MSSIHKFVVPGPIETQSSPVPIWELRMVTPVDAWTWMPSVLGLVPEAETLTPCSLTLLQPLITMWNIWLLRDVNPIIFMFFELENPNVCTPISIKKNKKTKLISLWLLGNVCFSSKLKSKPPAWWHHSGQVRPTLC